MKKLILAVLLCVGIQAAVLAQGFTVPKYDFKTAEDYPQYEQRVLDAYHWVLRTPIAEQGAKAEAVYEFIMKWAMGTPTVHIVLGDVLAEVITENNQLTGICLGGYMAYLLEAKKSGGVLNTAQGMGWDKQHMVDATYAAIRDVADYCHRNKDVLAQSKTVKKYMDMDKKGKLKPFIEKSFESVQMPE